MVSWHHGWPPGWPPGIMAGLMAWPPIAWPHGMASYSMASWYRLLYHGLMVPPPVPRPPVPRPHGMASWYRVLRSGRRSSWYPGSYGQVGVVPGYQGPGTALGPRTSWHPRYRRYPGLLYQVYPRFRYPVSNRHMFRSVHRCKVSTGGACTGWYRGGCPRAHLPGYGPR